MKEKENENTSDTYVIDDVQDMEKLYILDKVVNHPDYRGKYPTKKGETTTISEESAADFFGVQLMTSPTGSIFHLKEEYSTEELEHILSKNYDIIEQFIAQRIVSVIKTMPQSQIDMIKKDDFDKNKVISFRR